MIGILGGTFNPIHYGHIRAAEQIMQALNLREVQFTPCAIPVHRSIPQVDADKRLRMLELGLAGRPGLTVNTVELDRGGPSYMIETLMEVRAQKPDATLCLILGTDAFNAIESWKRSAELLNYAHLVVCCRPDIELDRRIYAEQWIDSVDALRQAGQGYILPLDIEQSDCSSTEIRHRLATGQATTECLPESVATFIINQHLYEN